ncbi:MAG: toll/interleukin-1 receptor domain-containing protein [Bacteroidota bacterium]
MQATTTIFIAYSSKDEQYLNELRVHLEPLKLYEIVDDIWFDGKIIAGQSWEEEIRKQLDTASIILLMLSPDFLFSDYCRNEMSHALERHSKEEATVIPIIARPCSWKLNPHLRAIEAAIKSRVISKAISRDECYVEITESLAEIAQKKKRDVELARLQAQEDDYWQKVQTDNTIPTYRKYLKTYPNGDYIKAAEKTIRKIEAEQEKVRLEKLQAQETSFWEKTIAVKKLPTTADYQKYLEKYPNGKYAAKALEAIELIKQKELDAAKARDDKAWKETQEVNSKDAYQDYLERFPNGLHQVAAKANN